MSPMLGYCSDRHGREGATKASSRRTSRIKVKNTGSVAFKTASFDTQLSIGSKFWRAIHKLFKIKLPNKSLKISRDRECVGQQT